MQLLWQYQRDQEKNDAYSQSVSGTSHQCQCHYVLIFNERAQSEHAFSSKILSPRVRDSISRQLTALSSLEHLQLSPGCQQRVGVVDVDAIIAIIMQERERSDAWRDFDIFLLRLGGSSSSRLARALISSV
jgi:hypothetical protein